MNYMPLLSVTHHTTICPAWLTNIFNAAHSSGTHQWMHIRGTILSVHHICHCLYMSLGYICCSSWWCTEKSWTLRINCTWQPLLKPCWLNVVHSAKPDDVIFALLTCQCIQMIYSLITLLKLRNIVYQICKISNLLVWRIMHLVLWKLTPWNILKLNGFNYNIWNTLSIPSLPNHLSGLSIC